MTIPWLCNEHSPAKRLFPYSLLIWSLVLWVWTYSVSGLGRMMSRTMEFISTTAEMN